MLRIHVFQTLVDIAVAFTAVALTSHQIVFLKKCFHGVSRFFFGSVKHEDDDGAAMTSTAATILPMMMMIIMMLLLLADFFFLIFLSNLVEFPVYLQIKEMLFLHVIRYY